MIVIGGVVRTGEELQPIRKRKEKLTTQRTSFMNRSLRRSVSVLKRFVFLHKLAEKLRNLQVKVLVIAAIHLPHYSELVNHNNHRQTAHRVALRYHSRVVHEHRN